MNYTKKEEEESWLTFKNFVIGLFLGSILGFSIGVTVYKIYTGAIKRSVWLEAVEHGYAEEVETSEGKAFIWKNSEYLDNRNEK